MYLLKRAIDGQVTDIQRLLGLPDLKFGDRDNNQMAPLHYAAWYNKHEAVASLIKHHDADVNAKDKEGATALHYAARYKQRPVESSSSEDSEGEEHKQNKSSAPNTRSVIRTLIQAGAKPNARDIYGVAPLFFAVQRGNITAVEELLACKEIDVESADKRKWSTLHAAAKYNQAEIASMLIDEGASVSARSDRDATPMHVACMEGNLDMINLFLKSTPKDDQAKLINVKNVDGESPLDLAIERRKLEAVKICLEYGADVRKTCREIQASPLHLAAGVGDEEICSLLLEKDKRLVSMRNSLSATSLHVAVEYKHPHVVELLIKWASSLEAQDEDNDTPLLTAAEYGSASCAIVLLENGARIHACDRNEQNSIHVAAKYNEIQTLEVLLDYMKQHNCTHKYIDGDDRNWNSPLHLAAKEGFNIIVEMLLDHGADLFEKNEDEETPLHMAAENGHVSVVSTILERCPRTSILNIVDEDNNTPLHVASEQGHTKVVQILLNHGADVTHRNRLFHAPIACAAMNGHHDVVELLLEMDSELDPIDRNCRTPLHLAAKGGHSRVCKLLIDKKANLAAWDSNGANPLDTAILNGQSEVAMVMVQSDKWKDALRNRTAARSPFESSSTPLRKLIRKMPVVADEVFDRCINFPKDIDIKDPELAIDFDFEFIDDTYSSATWGDPKHVKVKNVRRKVYDASDYVEKDAPPYTASSVTRIENHPLTVLIDSGGDEELVYHPLVLALVRHKWKYAQLSYFSFLFFYITFVTFITTFMVLSKPPYFYNMTVVDQLNISQCKDASLADMRPDANNISIYYLGFCSVAIWILSASGIIIEVSQLYSTPTSYMTSWTNILDWFSYIFASLVVMPIGPCNIRTDWQWQLGTVCMFISWIDIILYLRRLPGVGIYIVMVGEVFITFIKFFAFCFSLFIFAFGFTFYVLLRNQETFKTPAYSFAKTVVMMVGEMDFGDIFHDGDEFETMVVFEGLTYCTFIVFLCMVTIVIMNLLTGLAVGDVQLIQDQARIKKLAMQAELSLDVELTVPEIARKKLNMVVGKITMHPNEMAEWKFIHKLGKYFNGPLSSQRIAAAIFKDIEKQLQHEDLILDEQEVKGSTSSMKKQIIAQVMDNREKLQRMNAKIDALTDMMKQLLHKQKE